MRIVEHIKNIGMVTINDVVGMFKISRQAALKEIGKMIELEIITREGSAGASVYKMR
jgi:hypothetical protein